MTAPPTGSPASDERCDVLVVGAGPTGLTLAAQLDAFGVSVRVVDAATDRVRESRALAVQPRTLEVLRPFGLAAALVERGNATASLVLHTGRTVSRTKLFDVGLEDTAFPFLLFVSQAETEALLGSYLARRGVRVDRATRLEHFTEPPDGVVCTLRRSDGGTETVHAAWLAGCDGAHSTVRALTGTEFVGDRYPETFLLADLDVEELERGTVHAFLGGAAPLLLFPLGHPAPWRLVTMRLATPGSENAGDETDVSLDELQRLCDELTGGRVRLRQSVWATAFRVHHRQASRYRVGRAFLAGDAAHIHSPAGAQGMNTGIQDAVNLGWKLGLVVRGVAPVELLDSYEDERQPVGAFVLRFTDRAFTAVTSSNPVVRAVRSHVLPWMLPRAMSSRPGRRLAFRTVAQLGIRYRRSLAVEPGLASGHGWPGGGPLPGDRLPDVPVLRAGRRSWLHEALMAPAFHLLLCGPPGAFDGEDLRALSATFGDLLAVHRLSSTAEPGGDAVLGLDDHAFGRLGVTGPANLVVRPDGHIGYRADGNDLTGAGAYLSRWLEGAMPEG